MKIYPIATANDTQAVIELVRLIKTGATPGCDLAARALATIKGCEREVVSPEYAEAVLWFDNWDLDTMLSDDRIGHNLDTHARASKSADDSESIFKDAVNSHLTDGHSYTTVYHSHQPEWYSVWSTADEVVLKFDHNYAVLSPEEVGQHVWSSRISQAPEIAAKEMRHWEEVSEEVLNSHRIKEECWPAELFWAEEIMNWANPPLLRHDGKAREWAHNACPYVTQIDSETYQAEIFGTTVTGSIHDVAMVGLACESAALMNGHVKEQGVKND